MEAPEERNSQTVINSLIGPTIRLLQALCLPARHAKIVKFKTEIDGENSDRSLPFEPAQEELVEYKLQMESSVVNPQTNGTDRGCTVGIVIGNPNVHPVFLPANQLIGHLQPARCLSQ